MSQQVNNEEVTDLDDELNDDAITENEGENEGEEKDASEGNAGKKSLEELEEELEIVRIALKKANRESAKRRLELKQLRDASSKKPEGSGEEDKGVAKLQAEYDKMQAQLTALQTENHNLKLRGVVRSKAADLKLSFYSEEALGDAIGQIQTALGDEYDDEDVVAAIKQTAKARPYLFRKVEKSTENGGGSGTDAAKKGSSDIVVTAEEEAEIGKRFNIKS